MDVPFTTERFIDVLVAYNRGVWPMQIVLFGLALVAVAFAWEGKGLSDRVIPSILGFLWIWMGTVYHWAFFTVINKGAWLFGGLFVAQGLLFVYDGSMRKRLSFNLRRARFRTLAGLFLIYALIVYPVLGHLLGHQYPRSPTFGLPCPTTMFTFSLLLVAKGRVPVRLLVVPALWSMIGFTAALLFEVYEDIGLLVVGAVSTGFILWNNGLSKRSEAGKRATGE
jgi:hypothetical protein